MALLAAIIALPTPMFAAPLEKASQRPLAHKNGDAGRHRAVNWSSSYTHPHAHARGKAKAPLTAKKIEGKSDAPDSPGARADTAIEDVVMSAMKTRTTVQEAPAIISVLTGKEVELQGFRNLGDALGLIPSFLPARYGYQPLNSPINRAIGFGSLYLVDGFDMYDPVGFPFVSQYLPLQAMQRAEVVSGPGGVLWGSNSFVGVVNIVSKTADDLDGAEFSAGYGTGVHTRNRVVAHMNVGQKFFGDKLKVFAHASFMGQEDTGMVMPIRPVSSSIEPSTVLFQRGHEATGGRMDQLNVLANVQYGPWSLHGWIHYTREPAAIGQNGVSIDRTLGEDGLDCSNPANQSACAQRIDADRRNRETLHSLATRLAVLRYRNRFFQRRFGLDVRAFYGNFSIKYDPIILIVPSSTVPGGLGMRQSYISNRAGASLDTDIALPWGVRLLAGGEVFYDWMLEDITSFKAAETTLAQLPLRCPAAKDGNPCPIVAHDASNRLTGGLFLSAQKRILPNLGLSGGVRMQFYGGKRALDPVALFEGAAVWGFIPNWNLKLTYAEGFRPPTLLNTDNGSQVTWIGNPDLRVERSRAVQGEVNARLLQNRGAIRSLSVRADYAYTWVDDFISIRSSRFENVAEIGIHTIEFLAKLALKRGHSFLLGYTFNDARSSDDGRLRSIPAHWMSLAGVFNLWKRRLLLTSNALIIGPFEDPNQFPVNDGGTVNLGQVDGDGKPVGSAVSSAGYVDRVLDRVGATVLWNAGVLFRIPSWKLDLRADVYNILDARSYEAEGFMDLNAAFESVPSPFRGISFFARAQLRL